MSSVYYEDVSLPVGGGSIQLLINKYKILMLHISSNNGSSTYKLESAGGKINKLNSSPGSKGVCGAGVLHLNPLRVNEAT